MGHTTLKTTFRRIALYNWNLPQRIEVDTQSRKCIQLTHSVAPKTVQIWVHVVHHPGVTLQAADTLSGPATYWDNETVLDDVLPILTIVPTSQSISDAQKDLVSKVKYFANYTEWLPYVPKVRKLTESPEAHNTGKITQAKLLTEQASDTYCLYTAASDRTSASKFSYDPNAIFQPTLPICRAFQMVLPTEFQWIFLHLWQYPTPADLQPSVACTIPYNANFIGPTCKNGVYAIVKGCRDCSNTSSDYIHTTLITIYRNWKTRVRRNQYFWIVAKDAKGKSKHRRHHELLYEANTIVPNTKITPNTLCIPLLYPLFASYGAYWIPVYLLTDSRTRFVANFFETVYSCFGFKYLTSTSYHPQMRNEAVRYNNTIISRSCHYVADDHCDWDIYVQPLMYTYSTQIHRSTFTTPFSLTLTHRPLRATMIHIPAALETDAYNTPNPAVLRHCLLHRTTIMHPLVFKPIKVAQDRQNR